MIQIKNCYFVKLLFTVAVFLSSSYAVGAPNHEYNARFGPIGLILGSINADFDFTMNDQWTLGPSLNFVSYDGDNVGTLTGIDISGFAIGARGNWYYKGVGNSSWYVAPSIHYVSVSVDATGASGPLSADATGAVFSALTGYRWWWDNFNLGLGGGLRFGSLNDVEVTDGASTI
ncbi:hypothetical protein K2X05_06875, partial [bacterium]|nr:hypothetical protein [bacterium]